MCIRDRHQYSQPAAPGQKAVGSHAGTGALGHKGRAPNKGAQQQKQRVLGCLLYTSKFPGGDKLTLGVYRQLRKVFKFN